MQYKNTVNATYPKEIPSKKILGQMQPPELVRRHYLQRLHMRETLVIFNSRCLGHFSRVCNLSILDFQTIKRNGYRVKHLQNISTDEYQPGTQIRKQCNKKSLSSH